MISFPFVERVTVRGYDLYPGLDGAGEIDLDLGAGPWLVLGVNGLGKSTLLLMMRYLLAGSVKTRGAGFAGEREDLQSVYNRFFAVRVLDGAKDATAQISVRMGDTQLSVTRSLANLALVSAEVEHQGASKAVIADEADYRGIITQLMGVSQFEDVVRVLDHLVFYLEARQPLVWDGAAQFELFRALLTPTLSVDLRRLEGEIVSADSTARNLNATLYKITSRREKEAVKKVNASDTRARIASVQGELDALREDERKLSEEFEAAESERGDYNLQNKRAEKAVDDAAQEYEKLKFDVLRQSFAGVRPTEQYVFLKLLSDKICIACNQYSPKAAAQIQERCDDSLCVVCGEPRQLDTNVEAISDAFKSKATEAYERLETRRNEHEEIKRQFIQANDVVYALHQKLSAVKLDIEGKSAKVRSLKKHLPADESTELTREEERISSLRDQVQEFRKEREGAERAIEELLTKLKAATETIRERLEAAFDQKAAPFFAEKVRLVYAPRIAKIGQGGRSFEFPAFEIEMTSGATLSQFVRRNQDQVSLSQREYLDLIFRMVLVDVLGDGKGSLIVDGPEGSLDAIFAERAGKLFSRFGTSSSTNVILACNIVEGAFIPCALSGFPKSGRKSRVVNLLEQAMPTQALINLRPEYLEKVDQILAQDS